MMLKALRISAMVDAVLFAVLLVPLLSSDLLQRLFALGASLGDTRAMPMLHDPVSQLLVGLFALMALFFALVRYKDVERYMAATAVVKTVAVALFALAIWRGAPLILLFLLLADLIAALQHWACYIVWRKN